MTTPHRDPLCRRREEQATNDIARLKGARFRLGHRERRAGAALAEVGDQTPGRVTM